MSALEDSYGGLLTPDPFFSFWAVRLSTGKLISERATVADPRRSLMTPDQLAQVHPNWSEAQREHWLNTGERPVDWTLDLVSTGDIARIRRIWLVCPPHPAYPRGAAPALEVPELGRVFQVKVANLDVLGAWGNYRVAQVIGKVLDPLTGDCEVLGWDQEERRIVGPYRSNLAKVELWRAGLAPLYHVSVPVLGLHL